LVVFVITNVACVQFTYQYIGLVYVQSWSSEVFERTNYEVVTVKSKLNVINIVC